MDDVLFVRGFERAGNLPRDRQGFVEWNASTRNALRQVVALDKLHDQCGEIRCLLNAVDGRDVRVVEGSEDFGFALKAPEAIRIAGHRGGKYLDRHRPLQIAIGRAIDLAHAAGADRGDDLVGTETGAGGEGQTRGLYGPAVMPCQTTT